MCEVSSYPQDGMWIDHVETELPQEVQLLVLPLSKCQECKLRRCDDDFSSSYYHLTTKMRGTNQNLAKQLPNSGPAEVDKR